MPNVIFILTDDQGYGDMACHGNPWVKTPELDKLYEESIHFTDFHVGTTCAPSRSGLMTGKYCNHVGVWHTINGRSLLSGSEITLAESLKNAGYQTAIFGKWHLGDNYPFRPQDQGFDHVLIHGGGGVGQQPDYWNNDYFDDTYFRNGEPEKFEGYCTDVWFTEALNFIRENNENPFFCYLSTNAPHDPYYVLPKYTDLYSGNDKIEHPDFYGMITNFDENLGKLRRELKDLGIDKNTILVFMTDNGTSGGGTFDKDGQLIQGFNAGMRGKKGSPYEGGHRVPFFIHWPNGKLNKNRDITQLVSYIDFMPTILELCGIKKPENEEFDGISLKPLLDGNVAEWPNRVLFSDNQREESLVMWKKFTAMMGKWRLVNKTELYNIDSDPGQKANIADSNPDIVNKLLDAYEAWWEKISVNADKCNYIKIGEATETVSRLNSHDSHTGTDRPAWSQAMVRRGEGAVGFWAVEFVRSGDYEIKLYRWPKESKLKIIDAAPENFIAEGLDPLAKGKALSIEEAQVKINDRVYNLPVNQSDTCAKFNIHVEKGFYNMECKFVNSDKRETDAYYVYLKIEG